MNDSDIKSELNRLQKRRHDLNRLIALRKEVASLELERMTAQPQSDIINSIVATVCNHFHIGLDTIMSRSKRQGICIPRWLVFYLAHQRGMSCTALARVFNRNHTGILYAIGGILDKMDVEPEFKLLVQQLEKQTTEHSVIPMPNVFASASK